jgi:hypothetical protein
MHIGSEGVQLQLYELVSKLNVNNLYKFFLKLSPHITLKLRPPDFISVPERQVYYPKSQAACSDFTDQFVSSLNVTHFVVM